MKRRALALALVAMSSPDMAGQVHIGAVTCGEHVVELDTSSESAPGQWNVSPGTRDECGIRGLASVAGHLAGDTLVLEVPALRLFKREIRDESERSYTAGEKVWFLDWTASATNPGGVFWRGTARHGQSQVSAYSNGTRTRFEQAYWQEGGWRAGQWFDRGQLTGVLYGAGEAYKPLAREVIMSRFQAPVFSDAIRVLDKEGREVRMVKPGAAGLYDLTDIATAIPQGGRLLIDGQSYEPVIERRIEPGRETQIFIGSRQLSDRQIPRTDSYAYATAPWSLGKYAATYWTVFSDGGRIEGLYQRGGFTASGYWAAEARGNMGGANVSMLGVTITSYRPTREYQERAGSAGYASLSANRPVWRGFASYYATRYDTGTKVQTIRYSLPRNWGLVGVEAMQQIAAGKKDGGLFLTVNIALGKTTATASTSGAFSVSRHGDDWETGIERQVTLDGRQYDSVQARADLAAARVVARYSFTNKSAFSDASGRIAFGGSGIDMVRLDGDAVLRVEGPPGAAVFVDNTARGRIPASGRLALAVTSDMSHSLSLDDEESFHVVTNSEMRVQLHGGEFAKVEFVAEEMK